MPRSTSRTVSRWEALDDLRGLAILVMVPVNVAAVFTVIPAWFKHAPADGLTLADFVVPVFLFSLGLSASFSFTARLGAAALLLAVVEVLRPLGLGTLMQAWYDTGLAGPWGTFSLSFFAITASALGELLKDGTSSRRLTVSGLFAVILSAAALLARPLLPFSKHLVSLSYVLLTAGISSGLLAFLVLLRELAGVKLPILGSLGRNALPLYMLHAVMGIGVLALLGDEASAGAAWGASLLVLGLCAVGAVLLDRKSLYVKL